MEHSQHTEVKFSLEQTKSQLSKYLSAETISNLPKRYNKLIECFVIEEISLEDFPKFFHYLQSLDEPLSTLDSLIELIKKYGYMAWEFLDHFKKDALQIEKQTRASFDEYLENTEEAYEAIRSLDPEYWREHHAEIAKTSAIYGPIYYEFAGKYGKEWKNKEPEIRPYFKRIKKVFGNKIEHLYFIPTNIKLGQIELLADLCERYGMAVIGLTRIVTENIAKWEEKNRSQLMKIIEITRNNTSSLLFNTPHLQFFHLVEDINGILDLNAYENNLEGRIISMIPASIDKEGWSDLFELYDRYGLAAYILYKKQIHHYEKEDRWFIEELTKLKSSDKIEEVIMAYAFARKNGMDSEYLKKHQKKLLEIAEYGKKDLATTFQFLNPTDLRKIPKDIVALAKATRNQVGKALQHIPRRILYFNKKYFRELLERYHQCIGGVFEAFSGRDIMVEEEKYREIITKICKIGNPAAGKVLSLIPMNKWNDRIVQIMETYKEAVAKVLEHFQEMDDDFEQKHHELFKKMRENFGIFHIYRYSIEQLMTNLQNLSPEHQPEKPLAVFIIARSDHNDAFESVGETINFLSNTHKILFFEACTKQEIGTALEKTAQLHGKEEDGTPRKRVNSLILSGHADDTHQEFGFTSSYQEEDSESISLKDQNLFHEWSLYLSEKPQIVLHGCSTGKGGEKAKNLATSLKSQIKKATVFAPQEITSLISIDVNNEGQIIDVKFEGKEETLVLD